MRYEAKHKDGSAITSAFLGGKEYKASDDAIEVPDDHHDAHKAAALIGLTPAPEKPTPKGKAAPAAAEEPATATASAK